LTSGRGRTRTAQPRRGRAAAGRWWAAVRGRAPATDSGARRAGAGAGGHLSW